MKRKISIYMNIKAFNITLHDVDIILNNKYQHHKDKLNTGEEIRISTEKFKDIKGDHFPFYKNPKVIEIRAKEGNIKLGASEIICDD